MNVVAFNGSPNREGNTYQAIRLVTQELLDKNVDVEIIQVGNRCIAGCRHCGTCIRNQNEQCVVHDDINGWIQIMKQADGIILGSPVHYADISATMKAFLDRAFYVGANQFLFRHKVGAAVVALRRAGGIAAFDQLNNIKLDIFINFICCVFSFYLAVSSFRNITKLATAKTAAFGLPMPVVFTPILICSVLMISYFILSTVSIIRILLTRHSSIKCNEE